MPIVVYFQIERSFWFRYILFEATCAFEKVNKVSAPKISFIVDFKSYIGYRTSKLISVLDVFAGESSMIWLVGWLVLRCVNTFRDI